ncbi:MAG: adenylosuccinate synthase [Spirochaetaceae bacterium]|jgi:adenylosuccinate synthase|nr:adenylosuccinate synthase [Spirochaetaceae bacterium]
MVNAVVGLNWGDEGKGRMVDYFAKSADCVIRYQGGDNAGHTVINEIGKFAFHNFPSGICYKKIINIIASGSVFNPESFLKEKKELEGCGLYPENIIISDRAILILPYHYQLERLEEDRLKDKKYGSTMSGIAPTYSDKYLKKGVQVGELFYPEKLKEHLKDIVEYKNLILKGCYNADPIDYMEIYDYLMDYREELLPYIKNIQPIVRDLLKEGKKVIVEAQLGALRDITHGIYPMTTSSSVLAGYACASIPVPPKSINEIIGITKAYSTCVGEGAFTTELFDDLGDQIRKVGKEYGAKTGRPRRVGYFDAVATRYGAQLQNASSIVVTCLDVLSGIKELKICTHYKNGEEISEDFPMNSILTESQAVYESLPGWDEDITEIRNFKDLPENARKYIERIEKLIGVTVEYISVGPSRNALIIR